MIYLIFDLKNATFGMPIDSLERIIERSTSVFPLPVVPSFIKGIMNFQGRVITVVDLEKLFSMEEESEKTVMVMSKHIENTAFLVSSVRGFTELSDDKFESVDKFGFPSQVKEFVKCVAHGRDDQPVSVIDVGRMEGYLKNPEQWSRNNEA